MKKLINKIKGYMYGIGTLFILYRTYRKNKALLNANINMHIKFCSVNWDQDLYFAYRNILEIGNRYLYK